jgi:vacuole morphology and inheritance protein 14
MSCDYDSNVRYGAELLDRLLKDIVSENPHFDVDNFISLLRERMYTNNTFARQFLVSWILFLDSVPDIHMHEHVPEFIDALFSILGDTNPQIKKITEDALGELLKEIKQHKHSVRYEAMANLIASHCQSQDKIIQLIALRWMEVLIDLSQRTMLRFSANILMAVLPCLAYSGDKEDICKVAQRVNTKLKDLIMASDDGDSTTDLYDQIQVNLMSGSPKKSPPSLSPPIPTAVSGPAEEAPPTAHDEGSEASGTAGSSKTTEDPNQFSLLTVLGVLVPHMRFTEQETRLETLRWLLWLHQQLPKRIYRQAGKLFPPLLEMLTDISDRVLNLTLQVIATLSMSNTEEEPLEEIITIPKTKPGKGRGTSTSSDDKSSIVFNKYFKLFLVELIKLFNSDRILLENKGSLIVRHLCVYVDARAVYCTLAEILVSEEKLQFAALMVRELNTILFCATELFDLRMQLQTMDNPNSWELFKILYDCWCHNPIATVALCLLSQNYQHAANIVSKFGDIEITSEVLQEADKLVQLIESPIFTSLRLQLLSPHQYPHLVQTLYGLLMLLPQTIAYESLRGRLSNIPIINSLPHDNKKK